ncbi:MAG TPA: hypothetical protein VKE22_12620 [Haliangiales bacterium]|nr:hypothetical protein [Haliangiales bacterium]
MTVETTACDCEGRKALTWEEIRTHIRKRYKPITETPTSLSLECQFPNGGRQTVRVTFHGERIGGPALEVDGPVGDTHSLAPADALAYNHKAPTGSLALAGKVVVLRHMLSLKDATIDAIDQALTYVAGEAARLRRTSTRPPVPPELFAYLAS